MRTSPPTSTRKRSLLLVRGESFGAGPCPRLTHTPSRRFQNATHAVGLAFCEDGGTLGRGMRETGDADCHSQCAHWLRNDRIKLIAAATTLLAIFTRRRARKKKGSLAGACHDGTSGGRPLQWGRGCSTPCRGRRPRRPAQILLQHLQQVRSRSGYPPCMSLRGGRSPTWQSVPFSKVSFKMLQSSRGDLPSPAQSALSASGRTQFAPTMGTGPQHIL